MRLPLAAAASLVLGLVASAGGAHLLVGCSDCFDVVPEEVTIPIVSGNYRPTTSRPEDATFRLTVDVDAGTARESFERDGKTYVFTYALGAGER